MKKGSERKVSFSSRIGSDENDRRNQEMGLKQNAKNFMSPVVSAASKATFPRKKILAEINESNFCNTHLSENTPNFDSKASHKNSPNPDPKVTPMEPSSTSRPYDPLKNYLSPRPQFLRFNPSRQNEIFSRLEMVEKGGDALSDNSTSCNSEKADGDEADTVSSDASSQEDEEFEEEEVGWSLRRVLKYLLLLVVLALDILYISSTNSPTSALDYQKSQNQWQSSEVVGYQFLDGKKEQLGLLGLNQAVLYEGIVEEMSKNVGIGEIVSLELEVGNVKSLKMIEELKKDGEIEEVKSGKASDLFAAEDVELQKHKIEEEEKADVIDGARENVESEDELVKTGNVCNQLVEVVELLQLQGREETEEQIDNVEKVEDVKENGESGDVTEVLVETGEVSELLGEENAGETEFLQGDQASLLSEGTDYQEVASHTTDSSDKERVDHPKEAGEEIHKETIDDNMFQGKIIQFANSIGNPLKGINLHIGTVIALPNIMFGFLTFAAIVVSLIMLGSTIRRNRIASKHSTKPVEKEKPSLVIPAERKEHKSDDHVSSFFNTMPLITSVDKDTKGTYQIRAPTIELLGEFEVGGISSSSLKSCAIKSRMIDDEVSSSSDCLGKGLGSSNDMAGLDSEGIKNVVTSTPLRRSARIRSRSDFASP